FAVGAIFDDVGVFELEINRVNSKNRVRKRCSEQCYYFVQAIETMWRGFVFGLKDRDTNLLRVFDEFCSVSIYNTVGVFASCERCDFVEGRLAQISGSLRGAVDEACSIMWTKNAVFLKPRLADWANFHFM